MSLALRKARKEEREAIAAPFVAAHRAAARQACKSPRVTKLLDDPWIEAALKSAMRGASTLPTDEAEAKANKRFLSGLGHSFDVPPMLGSGPLSPGDLIDALDQITPGIFRWTVLILSALQEYHLEPDAARRWASVYKEVDELDRRIQIGAEALKDLTGLAQSLHPPSHNHVARKDTSDEASAAAERKILTAAKKPLRHIRDSLPPPLRLDGTASVRLLIYRLCIANRYVFRATKPAAIELFLQAAGLRPLDSRNVNRAINANSPYPPAKGAVEYRRILIANRDISAWAEK